jgi:glycosyltransferase involved in cell wall biosynthesis
MKILINISSLSPPLSGVGRYTLELIRFLLKSNDIEDVKGISYGKIKSKNEINSLILNLGDNNQSQSLSLQIKQKLKNIIKQSSIIRKLKILIEEKLLQEKIKQYKDYIYWEPNYILTKFDGIAIPTIYDASHVRFPQFHPPSRLQWLEDNMSTSIDKANRIITISEFSKQEIIDIYGVNDEKISIVYPAVSEEFRINYSELEINRVKEKYQLPQHYILSVGNIEPRKNIIGLLNAYDQLSAQHKNNYPLVIIGAQGWLTSEIEKRIQQIQKQTEIIRLGYVSQLELPLIYQAASLFIYVSLYEGFGMPIAEAMVSGIPVITSNCSSMPAVAKGCAKLVDPCNIGEISDTITTLIEDKSMQQNLVEKGLRVSKDYTWENSAKQLLEVFKEIE